MRSLALAFVSCFALTATACFAADEKTATVSPDQVLDLVQAPDGPLLLDVRTPEEFERGHVPGALLIPVQELPERLGQIEAFNTRGVVTCCERGRRASQAVDILREAGFEKLFLLEGSMKRWREEQRPTAAPTPAP